MASLSFAVAGRAAPVLIQVPEATPDNLATQVVLQADMMDLDRVDTMSGAIAGCREQLNWGDRQEIQAWHKLARLSFALRVPIWPGAGLSAREAPIPSNIPLKDLPSQVRKFTDPTSAEFQRVLEKSLPNSGDFFDEPYLFQYLATSVIPALRAARGKQPIRIWDLDCGNGANLFHLLINIHEHPEILASGPIELLGTSVSTEPANDTGQRLFDRAYGLGGLSQTMVERYFELTKGRVGPMWRIKDSIIKMVKWGHINFYSRPEALKELGIFDLIFYGTVFNNFEFGWGVPEELRDLKTGFQDPRKPIEERHLSEEGYIIMPYMQSIHRNIMPFHEEQFEPAYVLSPHWSTLAPIDGSNPTSAFSQGVVFRRTKEPAFKVKHVYKDHHQQLGEETSFGQNRIVRQFNGWFYNNWGLNFFRHISTNTSDGPAVGQAEAKRFAEHVMFLKAKGEALPPLLIVEEPGPGNGRNALTFLDYLKENYPSIYQITMYKLYDFIPANIELLKAHKGFNEHFGHVSFEVMDATKGQPQGLAPFMIRFNELFDDILEGTMILEATKEGLFEYPIRVDIVANCRVRTNDGKFIDMIEALKIIEKGDTKRIANLDRTFFDAFDFWEGKPFPISDPNSVPYHEQVAAAYMGDSNGPFPLNAGAFRVLEEMMDRLHPQGILIASDYGRSYNGRSGKMPFRRVLGQLTVDVNFELASLILWGKGHSARVFEQREYVEMINPGSEGDVEARYQTLEASRSDAIALSGKSFFTKKR